MYSWLAEAVESGTVIVTASRRLARDLLLSHTQQQLQSGHETWRTPDILYWGDWLNKLVESADPSGSWPTRMDPNSAAILWERCFANHRPDLMLSFASIVRQARQTWQRLQDWQVPLEEVSRSARNEDQQQFAKAAWAYSETLRKNNWADSATVPGVVAAALTTGAIAAPARVMFAGFDRITPSVTRLIQSLRELECNVEFAPVAKRTAAFHGQSFRDRQQELRSAGLWARHYLTRHPDARLAVISPELEADAARASRLVREGLAPGWQYADEASRGSVNASYGRRLADFPAIAVALLALRWIHDGLNSRQVSVLLRSPFLAGEMLSGRSRFELELRRWPDRSWTPASLAAVLRGKAVGEDAERWLQFIDSMVALRAAQRAHASPAHWAELFDRFLADNRWPGEPALDSPGYQLSKRWRALLGEFAATGLVLPSLPMSAATERLRSMAAEVIFQPESATGILQLLGMLEASSMSFDAVWICGLDVTRWPPPANPLMLVSRRLQEKYQMPDATPADSLEFAELVLQRIAGSARTVVVSWSTTEGEAELLPSPLLSRLQLQQPERFPDPGWHALELQNLRGLEWPEADPAPSVLPGEKIAGGAYTVQMQTVDPIAAFAHGRLGIQDLQRIEPGLPATLRGSIAHRVLHAFLVDKPNRDSMLSWSDAEIEERSRNALSAVFPSARRHLDPVHQKLLEFERLRLASILKKFVDAERSRPDFAVECVEERLEFERFGVRLGLRVDRVDRLADHTRLIIDYKTGIAKSLLNRDGDLVDLQLVVYAMAMGGIDDGAIGGLALINVDSREISYKGTGGSVEWDAKRCAEWHERLASWVAAVDDALKQLADGDVRTNTSLLEKQTRPLAILSRVAELRRER